jgi:hypothetical protein
MRLNCWSRGKIKTLTDKELLKDKQIKWFFEMESVVGEDGVNTVEMTTKDFNNT